MPHCLAALQSIYDRLGVRFDVQLGESFYDSQLESVVGELQERGLRGRERGSHRCLRRSRPRRRSSSASGMGRSPTPRPTWRRSSIAPSTWHPDQILYVVDHRQGDHFKQLFEVARRWGFGSIDLEHVAFGTILGPDRRPFKTREGDVVGLESLLDQATAEAKKVVDENSPDLDPALRRRVAEVVGLGAIKYADLAQNRLSDYVFDWQKMMAMNGNTATYLQYAYARIQSIFRKGGESPAAIRQKRPEIVLRHPAERGLGVRLVAAARSSRAGRARAQAQHSE